MEEQSPFVNAQEQLQPPPEVVKSVLEQPSVTRKKRPWVLFAVVGFLVGVLLILVMAAVVSRNGNGATPVAPTPTFAPPPTSSPKESALQKLKVIVDEADPDNNSFPPPQVDMEVAF